MATIGPIARVNTKLASINLDISRKLNWGNGLTLEFLAIDKSTVDGWVILKTRTKGFDRLLEDNSRDRTVSDFIIEVADTEYDLGPILRTKDVFIRVDDVEYSVGKVPELPSNDAQVYRLVCKVRSVRAAFDTTAK